MLIGRHPLDFCSAMGDLGATHLRGAFLRPSTPPAPNRTCQAYRTKSVSHSETGGAPHLLETLGGQA